MSAIRLLVLGVVRRQQPVHGYAVRRELLSWRAETWTNVKSGSIYHALKQLARDGALSTTGAERGDQGPSRTRYSLTEIGEQEFFELLARALVSIDMEELGAGIAFMDTLPRDEALTHLREQQRNSEEVRDSLLDLIPQFPGRDETPHAPDLLELWSGVFDNLAGWTGKLVHRLESGEYRMADDPQKRQARG